MHLARTDFEKVGDMLDSYSLRCPICGARAEIGRPIELGLLNEQNLPIRSLPVTCKEHGTKCIPYDAAQAPSEAEIQGEINRQFAFSL